MSVTPSPDPMGASSLHPAYKTQHATQRTLSCWCLSHFLAGSGCPALQLAMLEAALHKATQDYQMLLNGGAGVVYTYRHRCTMLVMGCRLLNTKLCMLLGRGCTFHSMCAHWRHLFAQFCRVGVFCMCFSKDQVAAPTTSLFTYHSVILFSNGVYMILCCRSGLHQGSGGGT